MCQEKSIGPSLTKEDATILLVDDELLNLSITKELLECCGYQVLAVTSGEDAVVVYREQKENIDLVVLDMIMPGIGGAKTFDMLRDIDPEVNVILSSGFDNNIEIQGIMEKGCQGFIQKPYRIKELSQKIKDVMQQRLHVKNH